MSLKNIKKIINGCLKRVYDECPSLIEKYDICERSIMHRLSFYLQKKFPRYWVDCEFNKMIYKGKVSSKILNGKQRFIDIVITKRNWQKGDFLCFELKKDKCDKKALSIDRNKLKKLTECLPNEGFQYEYGFLIILTKKFQDIKYEIYKKGLLIEKGVLSN